MNDRRLFDMGLSPKSNMCFLNGIVKMLQQEPVYDPNFDVNYKEEPFLEWRSLAPLGYPNYVVSSRDAVVWNLSANRQIKPHLHTGYHRLSLFNGEKQRATLVHVIICTIFHGFKSDDKLSVNHKDKNRLNNDADNLEWSTPKQQRANQDRSGKHKSERWVTQMDLYGNELFTWFKLKDAAKEYKLSPSNLPKACTTGSIFGGYKWKYEFGFLPGEIWAKCPIADFTDLVISNKGRYFNTISHKLGYGMYTPGGYKQVRFSVNGKVRQLLMHIAVARTFIGESFGKIPNHLDGNKINNKVENLQYATLSENVKHAHDTGLIVYNNGARYRAVNQFTKDGVFMASYPSITHASKATGCTCANIHAVCVGNRVHSLGFAWRYA